MRESPDEPSADESCPEWAEVLETIVQSLTAMNRWMESVNTHLAQLGERTQNQDGRSEREALKEELDKVLQEIARVKSETEGSLEKAELRRQLGKLRIRQTKLLLRMGSNPGSDDKEDDFFRMLI